MLSKVEAWLLDCLDAVSQQDYAAALEAKDTYYAWWQQELNYRRYLHTKLSAYQEALEHACSHEGDLCNYCIDDWHTCGQEFTCDCPHFRFNMDFKDIDR